MEGRVPRVINDGGQYLLGHAPLDLIQTPKKGGGMESRLAHAILQSRQL